MITLTEGARQIVVTNGIKEIYLELKYTKGPCADNLCKMIPHVEISLVKHSNSYSILYDDSNLKVFASQPIFDSIVRHKDVVIISKTRLRNALKVTGITYSY
jgi:hypothetical protein